MPTHTRGFDSHLSAIAAVEAGERAANPNAPEAEIVDACKCIWRKLRKN